MNIALIIIGLLTAISVYPFVAKRIVPERRKHVRLILAAVGSLLVFIGILSDFL